MTKCLLDQHIIGKISTLLKWKMGKVKRFCNLLAYWVIINNAKLTELARQLRKYLKERLQKLRVQLLFKGENMLKSEYNRKDY